MARPTFVLVQALRETARRLRQGAEYRWSSFSACNCGNLVQTVTSFSAEQIREAAFRAPGDWGEQARDYCPGTGYPLEFIFDRLFELGLERDDFGHLERLSDPYVCRRIGRDVELRHNRREDVITYLLAWAELLEEQLPPALCEAAE